METNSTTDQPQSEPQVTPAPELAAAPPATPTAQPELALSEPNAEPAAELAAEPAAESASPATEPTSAPEADADQQADELTALAIRSQAARLPVADEERMGALLKEALLAGKAGLLKAVEILPKLPWIVGIRAVENAWPEMKTTARAQLLKGLADIDSDTARRIRLSLARALFKLDPATSLKLATSVCKELRDKETGALSQKHAQIFANVFIGKVKPWLATIPLADLKAPDAELLVHCALLAVFSLPHPPVTQLGVLRWAGEAGRLTKLHETALAAVTRNTSRWSAKWQAALRKEVAELPEEIALSLKAPGPEAPAAGSQLPPQDDVQDAAAQPVGDAQAEPLDSGEAPQEAPRKERPVYEPRPQKAIEPQRGRDRGRDRNRDPERENEREGRDNDRDTRKERPVYQARNAGGAQNFNLSETLRQIEAHVQSLRSELSAAQLKARQKDDDLRPSRRQAERPTAVIPGEPTVEELARLNLQLEARIAELQLRITELGTDAEDRAASIGAHGDQQVTDVNQQLRTLLGFKLQEDFADYQALQDESTSVVVQQHYRSLLGHIFEVLAQEGVTFKTDAPERADSRDSTETL